MDSTKNIKLNTKKIDLLNGDYYNIERTKQDLKSQDWKERPHLQQMM